MQQLDSLTLKHLALELSDMLLGSKINKIQQVTPHEFLIGFWGARMDRRQRLYINTNPKNPCCFLISASEVEQFIFQTLEKPTGFCMLLRKHLNSARVIDFKTLPGERVLSLILENYNELGNKTRLILSIELVGHYSNLILVDDLPQMILGAAHSVSSAISSEKNQKRDIAPGLPYAVPPSPEGKRLLLFATVQDLKTTLSGIEPHETQPILNALKSSYWGLSTPILREILERTQGVYQRSDIDFSEQLYHLINQFDLGKNLNPSISNDFKTFDLFQTKPPKETSLSYPSLHEMVSSYMTTHLTERRIDQFKHEFSRLIQRQKTKLNKRLNEQKPADPIKIEQLSHYGNLILNGISSKALSGVATQSKVQLLDYMTQEPIEIDVKLGASWLENAQRYFKKSKKEKARQKRYQGVEEELQQEIDYLNGLSTMTDQTETLTHILALREDLISARILKVKSKNKKNQTQRKIKKNEKPKISGLFKTASSDNMKLLIGKSGQANADLVGRLSKPEDLWLHVHEAPGSHVLIQTEKQPVSDQTLLEAASLAVYFSSARHSKNVPVIYTQARYVKKITSSYPGHVNYKNEKTVFITPQPELIEQLLTSPNH